MFSGAMAVHDGETIAQLKEEIENLKSLAANSWEIPVESIVPLQLPGEMKQPRLYFDPYKMERLKDSIHKHGVLEPILLRPGPNGIFEIISGERRWRCCQALGKKAIPAIVRQMSDSIALEAALIAHLLNEEISPIEQTESILSLLSLRLSLSVDEVKASLYLVKNSRVRGTENSRIFSEQQLEVVNEILSEFGMKLSSFVSNRLPMLNLTSGILTAVREGNLSPTNAVLINRQPQELHESLILEAEGMTKSDLVALIKAKVSPGKKTAKKKDISTRVYERLRSVRKQSALLEKPEVKRRLEKIDQLLKEIEAIGQ